MTPKNHKLSRSITVSHLIVIKIKTMIENGKFSTYSDAVSTAIIAFIGKISVLESTENVDPSLLDELFKTAINKEKNDRSKTEKISVSLNNYVIDEITTLTEATGKNRSFILRLAIYDFIHNFENPSPYAIKNPTIINLEDYPQTTKELENFIIKTIEKINHDSD